MGSVLMTDSVGDVPAWSTIIGGYVDGIYENYERLHAAHPTAFMVGITATGIHDPRTRVADCENGDLTPQSMARWSYDEKTKYNGPGDGYWSLSLHDEVAAEMEKVGLQVSTIPATPTDEYVNWWCADYVGHPYLAPGSVATQFEDVGPYDLTSTNGVWPVNDVAPIPPSNGMLTNCRGMILDPLMRGYWEFQADGGIFTHSAPGKSLPFFGSLGGKTLAQPVVGGSATPDGKGYWLVAADGGVFAFGDAGFFGSVAGVKLAKPVVDIATTPTGKGYWLVAEDGGIFNFGDAAFWGAGAKLDDPTKQ